MLFFSLCFAIAFSKPYQFVHITKTGGTALDKHFAQYYSKYIETDTWLYRNGQFKSKIKLVRHFWREIEKWEHKCYPMPNSHDTTTRQAKNPIVVLRDPFERIVSNYNYWKYGSEMWSIKNENASFESYVITILRNNHTALQANHTWREHYKPMVNWIHEEDYAKTTIVNYNDDLNVVLKPLLKSLNIPFKDKNLTSINKTNKYDNITLTSTMKTLIRKIYAEDFVLLQTVKTHPERFSAVIGIPIIPEVETKKDVRLIYITHIDDEYQRNKISELYGAFGSKLIVSWDNKEQPECPFPNITCINVTLDKVRTYDWISSGTGHEKAVMWSMKNYHTFDRVWIMEEDVYYSDISFLHQIVTFDYDRDLILIKRPKNVTEIIGEKLNAVLTKQWKKLQISNWVWSLQQFFGASKNMLKAMHQTYTKNNNTLIFLETMWSTTANIHGLKIGGWYSYFESFSKNFRFRPCHTNFSIPGLYHPGKNRNGSFINCSLPEHNNKPFDSELIRL